MLDQSGLLVLIAAQPLQHFQRQTLLAERGIDLVQRAIDHVLVLVLDVSFATLTRFKIARPLMLVISIKARST